MNNCMIEFKNLFNFKSNVKIQAKFNLFGVILLFKARHRTIDKLHAEKKNQHGSRPILF